MKNPYGCFGCGIREMYYDHLACLHEISIQIVSFSLPLFNYIILKIRVFLWDDLKEAQ